MNFFKKLFSLELEYLFSVRQQIFLNDEKREAYVYNNYLVLLVHRDLYYQLDYGDEQYESFIYEDFKFCGRSVDHLEIPGDWCFIEQVSDGNKREAFLAACRRIDDIILAKEGF